MISRIESLSCNSNNHLENCQNAISDGKGGLRCRIYDIAHAKGSNILKLEDIIHPILFHIKGCGETTRCMYSCGCLQRLCCGYYMDRKGIENLIKYSENKEGIIFPEKKEQIIDVFGPAGYERIRKEILT